METKHARYFLILALTFIYSLAFAAEGDITFSVEQADGTQSEKTLPTDASIFTSQLDLGDAAFKNTGTTAGTVAAGDDARFAIADRLLGDGILNLNFSGTVEINDNNGSGGVYATSSGLFVSALNDPVNGVAGMSYSNGELLFDTLFNTVAFDGPDGKTAWVDALSGSDGFVESDGTLAIDGFSSYTGTLPGANVQASGTGNAGVVFITGSGTTDVITGTNTTKAVTPFSLAAWWTWIKTQAQTVAGNWTLTGNTTLGDASGDTIVINGQATGVNQDASSSSSYMTRSLIDEEFLYRAQEYVVPFVNLTSGATGSGMAVVSSYQGALQLSYSLSGTSLGTESSYYTVLRGLGGNPASGGGTYWGNKVRIRFSGLLSANAASVGSVVRFLAGTTANNTGTLANKGVGVEIVVVAGDNFSTTLLQHDGSTLTPVSASFNPGSTSHSGFTFVIESNNGVVRLFGGIADNRMTLLATGTNGPTGTGPGSNDYVVMSLTSGTAGQVNPSAGVRLRQVKVQY